MEDMKNINNIIKTLGHLSSKERSQVLSHLHRMKQTPLKKEPAITQMNYIEPLASFWQEQMWYLEQLSTNLPTYNVPFRFNLKGPLNVKSLNKSLKEIELRHESLRTNIRLSDGKIVQTISPLRFKELEVTDMSKQKNVQKSVIDFTQKFMKTSFNLEEGPLYRVHLLKLDKYGNEHVLLWVGSHAIADGWSLSIIIKELISLYNSFLIGEQPTLDELSIQFGDFSTWQRDKLSGANYERILNYWKKQLDNYEPLKLETDFTRPSIQNMKGDTCSFFIPQKTKDKIAKISKTCGVTSFTLLLAAYQLLLSKYTGQNECIVGTGINGRTNSELETLIGSFVNIVPIRTQLNENLKFVELVEQVRHVTLDAIAHQDLPFGKLVQELEIERNHSKPPLCQTIFIYGSTPLLDNDIKLTPELDLSWDGVSTSTVKFDFELAIDERHDGLYGRLDYSTSLFKKETIEVLCQDYINIIESITENPEFKLSDLSPSIGKKILKNEDTIIVNTELLNDIPPSTKTTKIEKQIINSWSKALGIKEVTKSDDFFSLGGHSVMAAQMVMEFRTEFNVDLTLQNFLENTTIYSLANVIEELSSVMSDEEEQIELIKLIEQMTNDEVEEQIMKQIK
ncbi:condensation domain-containing protein [Staphylococcus aureus]|uniref:condensation domain-containing protein n=1 Tax=Staphylococcus aureus TaxID=1280 RepID=UPI001248E6D3|nr:condensation domain-containing protein [Staphylococcus aureus]